MSKQQQKAKTMSNNENNTTPRISQEQRLARIIDVCDQVNMDAICARWTVSTGESLITLRTIALNRVIEVWNSDFDTSDISSTGATVTGWVWITIANVMKEHYAFTSNHGQLIEQYPENDSNELIPLNILEQEQSRERMELTAAVSHALHMANTRHTLDRASNAVGLLGARYVKKYSQQEWINIVRSTTAYHRDTKLTDVLKTLCEYIVKNDTLTQSQMKQLHDLYRANHEKTTHKKTQ